LDSTRRPPDRLKKQNRKSNYDLPVIIIGKSENTIFVSKKRIGTNVQEQKKRQNMGLALSGVSKGGQVRAEIKGILSKKCKG
jgi:hypothetical protein